MPEQAWYAVAVCIEKDGNGWSVEYGTILDVVQASSLDEAKGQGRCRGPARTKGVVRQGKVRL